MLRSDNLPLYSISLPIGGRLVTVSECLYERSFTMGKALYCSGALAWGHLPDFKSGLVIGPFNQSRPDDQLAIALLKAANEGVSSLSKVEAIELLAYIEGE
jgi:hypothetical protein